jgi:hypothetical protein
MIIRAIKILALIIIVALPMASCVDEYWPDLGSKYNKLLVVDGLITTDPGPYLIKLSTSTSVDQPAYIPFEGAEVFITDDLGNTETLTELDPGEYYTTTGGMRGVAERKYKLNINTTEGKNYESEFELLISPKPIDSVYAMVEYKQDDDYDHDLAGYQFYLDTKVPGQDTIYFLWNLEATFKYQVDYFIRWIFDGDLDWFYHPDSLYTCFSTYQIPDLYLFSTEDLSIPEINHLPFHFVSTETRTLSLRYSLFVEQLSLNRNTYQFWEKVDEQNNNQGVLYLQQPYQIRGNVSNIDDPSEPVLGMFMVAGKSTKRIFVDRPPVSIPFYYTECELDDADFESYGQMWMADPVFYPIYAIETPGGQRAVPDQACVDCRRHGGTIIIPDFWID